MPDASSSSLQTEIPLHSPKGMEWVVELARISSAFLMGALVCTSTAIWSPTTMRGLFWGNWPTRVILGRPGRAREGGEKNSALVSAVTCGG